MVENIIIIIVIKSENVNVSVCDCVFNEFPYRLQALDMMPYIMVVGSHMSQYASIHVSVVFDGLQTQKEKEKELTGYASWAPSRLRSSQ